MVAKKEQKGKKEEKDKATKKEEEKRENKESPKKEEEKKEEVKAEETKAEEETEKKEEKKEGKEEEISEEEALRQFQEAIDRLSTKDMVTDMMISLSSVSYKKLGLPEETNKKHRDLDQAKQAIDCLGALVDAIEPALSAEEVKMFKQTVSNLRMAYISQNK